jgi:hypothetical protein
MGILSEFEDRIAAGIEGLFAGAFKTPVQPAELANALGRAMDDGRAIGVGRVYAPTEYTIGLSYEDDAQLGRFKTTLSGELATFLVDHAREHGYHLAARPTVSFIVRDDLRLGRFGVAAALAQTPAAERPAASRRPTAEPGSAFVTVGTSDERVHLTGSQVDVGRLEECGICLDDSNVSRRHAAFMRFEDGWAIEDLDSTNGTRLNGQPVRRARLQDGDVIEIGLTLLHYHGPGE